MANSGRSSGQAPIGRRGPKAGSNIAARTIPADLNSNPGVALDACRDALAPTLHAQMEGLKAIERFGRYQYSVAGDYLEWGVAQARANLTLGTPAEHFASQTTLSTQFGEKLQGRVREFMNLASETRASFNQLLGEATARLAETIKQSP
jgi:hypothetical protein